MTAAREYLLTMLRRIADGGDLTTDELDSAVPDPLLLESVEKDAWEELSHWADDDDIRAKDAGYATLKRAWMRRHIAALEG